MTISFKFYFEDTKIWLPVSLAIFGSDFPQLPVVQPGSCTGAIVSLILTRASNWWAVLSAAATSPALRVISSFTQ